MVVCDTNVLQCQSGSLDNYFLAVWLHVFIVKWQEWQPLLNGSDQDYFQNTLLANTVYSYKAENLPPIIRTQKHHIFGHFKTGLRTSRKDFDPKILFGNRGILRGLKWDVILLFTTKINHQVHCRKYLCLKHVGCDVQCANRFSH